MVGNLNIKNQKTLRELEETISNLNIPILVFKELLKAIKNNDFSNLSNSVNKLRYMTSEEKVKEQIDRVIYQQVYNNKDYNNLITVITKLYAVLDSLIEARMNISDVYKQDIAVVEDVLDSYGFDIHKIFDEYSKRDLAHRIYYFLRRKGTTQLLGDLLNRLGYTHYVITEYSLNRENMDWKFVPEKVEISDAAKEWEQDLMFYDIDFEKVSDILWYLDDTTLNNILFDSTNLYPKNWDCSYEMTYFELLNRYLGLSMCDYSGVERITVSKDGSKMAIVFGYTFEGYTDFPEFERTTRKVKDGLGENVLMESSEQYTYKRAIYVIDLIKNEVIREYTLHDDLWWDYYKQEIPEWQPNTEYYEGQYVLYNDSLKRCKMDHVSGDTFEYYYYDENGTRVYYWTTCASTERNNVSNWWIREGYLDDDNNNSSLEYRPVGLYFSDSNTLNIFTGDYLLSKTLSINITNNTITTLINSVDEFKHIYTGQTIPEFNTDYDGDYGERYDIVGKHGNYFILSYRYHSISTSDFYFINIKDKTWFSLDNDLLQYYPNIIQYMPFLSDDFLHIRKERVFQNKLWFDVTLSENGSNKNYLIGIDLDVILKDISEINQQEDKQAYVSNIIENSFKLSLEEFDEDFVLNYMIGMDDNIYISGILKEDENTSYSYEDNYYWNSIVFKCVNKNGEEIRTLYTGGDILYPCGMDSNNNIILLYPFSFRVYINSTDYTTVYSYIIQKIKPIFTHSQKKLMNTNMVKTIYVQLPITDIYPPLDTPIINAPKRTTLYPTTSGYNRSAIFNNELYLFDYHFIYKYDAENDIWIDISLPLPEGDLYSINSKASELDYNVYFISAYTYSNIYMIYNFLTKKATIRELPFQAKNYFTVETINRKLYVFGGYNDGYYSTMWEYDIKRNIWTEKTPCPVPHAYHSSTVYNGKLYVFGGRSASYTYLRDTWVYDPIADSWEQKVDFPGKTSSYQHTATTIGDKLYYYVEREMWEYDPLTDTWTQKASGSSSMPYSGGYIMETLNGKAYLFGGGSSYSPSNRFWEYNPLTNTWVEKSNSILNT